jgi:hypothetical protein
MTQQYSKINAITHGIRDDIGAKSGFHFNIVLLWLALKLFASTSHHYLGRRIFPY